MEIYFEQIVSITNIMMKNIYSMNKHSPSRGS